MVHSRRVVLKHLQRCGHNWLIFWRQLRKGGNQSHCTHCTQRNLGNTKEVPLSKTAQDDWTKPFILKKKIYFLMKNKDTHMTLTLIYDNLRSADID